MSNPQPRRCEHEQIVSEVWDALEGRPVPDQGPAAAVAELRAAAIRVVEAEFTTERLGAAQELRDVLDLLKKNGD